MQYFFILGNNFNLNKAELFAFLNFNKLKFKEVLISEPVIVLDISILNNDFVAKNIENILGGLIKYGLVESEIKNLDQLDIKNIFTDLKKEGKNNFGISSYLFKTKIDVLGIKIKKYLKQHVFSIRYVSSKENPLSSVIVKKEILNKQGIELVIIKKQQSYLIGKTQAVQLFEEFEKRDYNRPVRDLISGMLPPKVAKIMINLASQKLNSLILDPFCGHGTVLQELLLLGYKNIIGSDIDKAAVLGSQKNIDWLKKNYDLKKTNVKIFLADSQKLSNFLKNSSIDSIISEPFMGPALKGSETPEQIVKNKNNLTALYKKSFIEFAKILKKQGLICIIIPKFKVRGREYIFEIKNLIPNNLKRLDNNDLFYSRPNQKVIRQIILLQKK